MSTNPELEALKRLVSHLEKEFDSDSYIKDGKAKADIELLKNLALNYGTTGDKHLPIPNNCHFNHYYTIKDTCEKCENHETCAHFKDVYKQFKEAEYEIYSEPYREGRYNGD